MFRAIPQSPEYLDYADAHWHELIERYRPDVLWNDIGYPAAADLDALFDRYYEAVPEGVVNNRFDWMAQSSGGLHCDFVTPEYSTVGDPNRKWESTRGIGTSFGYNRQESEDSYLAPGRARADVRRRGGPRRQPPPQRRPDGRGRHPVGAGPAAARARMVAPRQR